MVEQPVSPGGKVCPRAQILSVVSRREGWELERWRNILMTILKVMVKQKGGTRMAKKSIIEGDGMLENERFLLNSNSTYDCLLIAPQDRG